MQRKEDTKMYQTDNLVQRPILPVFRVTESSQLSCRVLPSNAKDSNHHNSVLYYFLMSESMICKIVSLYV